MCHNYRHQQPLLHEKIRMFHSHITKVFSTFVLKCCCTWDFSSIEQVSLYPLPSVAFSTEHSGKSSLFLASFGCRDTDSFMLWAAKWKTEKNVVFCPKHDTGIGTHTQYTGCVLGLGKGRHHHTSSPCSSQHPCAFSTRKLPKWSLSLPSSPSLPLFMRMALGKINCETPSPSWWGQWHLLGRG